jgi:death-on-curing protein
LLTPNFLDKIDVLIIHNDQVSSFGGTPGIRDDGLLDSALAQPQATFGGQLLHPAIAEQAAAYMYHLAMNHPFLDGNKRTAFAVMDTFLRVNGYILKLSDDDAYEMVLAVVQGQMTKAQLAATIAEFISSSN